MFKTSIFSQLLVAIGCFYLLGSCSSQNASENSDVIIDAVIAKPCIDSGMIMFQGREFSWKNNVCLMNRLGKIDTVFGSKKLFPGETHSMQSVIGPNFTYLVQTNNSSQDFFRTAFMDNPKRAVNISEIFDPRDIINALREDVLMLELGSSEILESKDLEKFIPKLTVSKFDTKQILNSFVIESYDSTNYTAKVKLLIPFKDSTRTEKFFIDLELPVTVSYREMFAEASGKTLYSDLK